MMNFRVRFVFCCGPFLVNQSLQHVRQGGNIYTKTTATLLFSLILKYNRYFQEFPFNFVLEYAIRNVQETNLRLAAMAYVNLIDVDIRTIKINADVQFNTCKYIDLAVNTGKYKYMEIGRPPGMITNEHIRICSNSQEK